MREVWGDSDKRTIERDHKSVSWNSLEGCEAKLQEMERNCSERRDNVGKEGANCKIYRYAVYGEIQSREIRVGNIIMWWVKKLKGREKERDEGKRWGTATEKGKERGKGWNGRRFSLWYGWNPKCSEGALSSCVVPRQHHSRIPWYRGASVLAYVYVHTCVCTYRCKRISCARGRDTFVFSIYSTSIKKDLKRIKEKYLHPFFSCVRNVSNILSV